MRSGAPPTFLQGLSEEKIFEFFFQAEDGIRDFCLSRGLGDVYKRQVTFLVDTILSIYPVSAVSMQLAFCRTCVV